MLASSVAASANSRAAVAATSGNRLAGMTVALSGQLMKLPGVAYRCGVTNIWSSKRKIELYSGASRDQGRRKDASS